LMTGGVVYEAATQNPLPHAYMGAVRHALTVGFMTTLILGVGQRVVPVLDRTVLAMPRLTVPILVLIGVGNFLRVGTEMATIFWPLAYDLMPISALLEWSALLLFAINITATMFHSDPLLKRGRVTKRSSLAVLVAEHPWIEDRLRPTGTRYLERARSVPDELTIASFAESEGFDAAELVSKINGWLTFGTPFSHNSVSPSCESQRLAVERRP
ncbi:MAG TPA: NnrS family protein, partial [Lacipirellulaceae bacterium]|nr:NnrS family protein [Lacipirellulaceae bacterium]